MNQTTCSRYSTKALKRHANSRSSVAGDEMASTVVFALAVANVGLLLIDHVHFQYNGWLLGIFVLSLACIHQVCTYTSLLPTAHIVYACASPDRSTTSPTGTTTFITKGFDILGAVFFTVLVNSKHLYLCASPIMFVFLLRRCWLDASSTSQSFTPPPSPMHPTAKSVSSTSSPSPPPATWRFSILKFTTLALVVIGIFAASFGPWIQSNQIPQVLARLFPFHRGLYVALPPQPLLSSLSTMLLAQH
jgi:alpha-1,3-glucosyltransferase